MNKLLFSLSVGAKSRIEEMWDYFADNYLESKFEYPNLGIHKGSPALFSMIVLGIFLGVVLSAFAVIYDNFVIGRFVRKMISEGAVGKGKAIKLCDLGTDERSNFARALRTSVGLRRVVRCVEEEEFFAETEKARAEYDKKREDDPSLPKFKIRQYKFGKGEHFYIPEDKKTMAEVKFANRGIKPWAIPLIIVGGVVGFFVLMRVLPEILRLCDQLVGSFKSL